MYIIFSGYFFYQNQNGGEGDSSSLLSPVFTSSLKSTLRFYSYFSGSEVGSLELFTVTDRGDKSSLWYKSGEQDRGWLQSCVQLNQASELVIEFVATQGSGEESVIAVDNVTVSEEPCHCKYLTWS